MIIFYVACFGCLVLVDFRWIVLLDLLCGLCWFGLLFWVLIGCGSCMFGICGCCGYGCLLWFWFCV